MSLPRYPVYKESGVGEMGAIPESWSTSRLKAYVSAIDSGVSVNSLDVPASSNEVGVLKTSCVYDGTFRANESKVVVSDELDRVACPVVKDAIIVSRMNTPALVGAAGLVRDDWPNLFLPDRLWQVRVRNCYPAFVCYWMQTPQYRGQVKSACSGTSSSMQNLGQDDFRNFVFPVPSPEEQEAIVEFLGRETTKIDVLIAEQETLLVLLAEKRQVTISRAVTRGLDPDVPMKDSGVSWLGELPAHWEVKRIKYGVSRDGYKAGPFGSSLITSDLRDWGEILVLTPEHVARSTLSLESNQFLPSNRAGEMSQFFVNQRDVVFPIVGSLGRAMVVTSPCPGILNQRLARITPDERVITSEYLKLLMTEVELYKKLDEVERKGAIINHITKDSLLNRFSALPPVDEQRAILAWLEHRLGGFDRLVKKTQRMIELLAERRSALIAAAVTGKIDVRGLAA